MPRTAPNVKIRARILRIRSNERQPNPAHDAAQAHRSGRARPHRERRPPLLRRPREQERHRRYQEASQKIRVCVIQEHLHLLRELVDVGGIVVLLSDVRGFVFDVSVTDNDAQHRRTLPIMPRGLAELVGESFTVLEEHHWEWITDLPEERKLGRGYEVVGYVLSTVK